MVRLTEQSSMKVLTSAIYFRPQNFAPKVPPYGRGESAVRLVKEMSEAAKVSLEHLKRPPKQNVYYEKYIKNKK